MTVASDTILRVDELGKTFKKYFWSKGHRAIDGVTLDVGRGTVFGLLGPNGAGKTTLIKVLLGLCRGYDGTATLFGQPPRTHSCRRRVGYLPEAHRLPQHLTGRQVLRLFGMMCGKDKSWIEERIPRWLERVDMTKDADRKVREYSKGMQQRIGLAQALVHEPELVFLDEPTDGVDPVGRKAIRRVVQELKDSGVTLFINSHLLMEVEMMCDQVVIMHQGAILREGTIEELTPDTGSVRIRLASTPYDLEQILAGLGRELIRHENDFELRGLAEGELDRAIDSLRRANCSIRAVEPRRLTLEEAFIDLVERERGGAA